MKKFSVFILPLFFTGCSYFLQGQLELTVASHGAPLPEAQITVAGIVENKEVFIQNLSPNKEGKVFTNIDFSKYQSLKLITTNSSIETLLLPDLKYVPVPHWWQKQSLQITIELKPILPEENKPLVFNSKNNSEKNALDKENKLTPEIVVLSQIESNLIDPLMTKPKIIAKKDEIEKLPTSLLKNLPEEKTITEKNSRFLSSSTYRITSDNQPLSNALVFTGDMVTQALRQEEETDAKGEVKIEYNKATAPKVIVVKKNGFLTSVLPFVQTSTNDPVTIDLKTGKSLDFLVQNFAYGLARGMDKTELYYLGSKLDSSGPLGFLTSSKEIKPEEFFSLKQKNSIENMISPSALKNIFQTKTTPMATLYLSSQLPFKPAVGLLEPIMTPYLETNSLWRRARREFFSRFINEQKFRTKIQDDLLKIINAKSIESLKVFRRGWQTSNFAKDVDIVLDLNYEEELENKYLVGRIYTKNGENALEIKKLINEKNAEDIASQLYLSLLDQLPVECDAVGEGKGSYTLNGGKNINLHVDDYFIAYGHKQLTEEPNKFAGVMKVTQVDDLSSHAVIIFGEKENNQIVHLIRTSKSVAESMQEKKFSTNQLNVK